MLVNVAGTESQQLAEYIPTLGSTCIMLGGVEDPFHSGSCGSSRSLVCGTQH